MTQEERKDGRFRDRWTKSVVGALIEVHRGLGPGLLESAYEACLCSELDLRGMRYERQKPLRVTYKGSLLECGYRLDFVVEDEVLLELKSVEQLLPIHKAQLITYLRLANLPVGLLVNFNVPFLKNGLRRLTPHHDGIFRPSVLPVKNRTAPT